MIKCVCYKTYNGWANNSWSNNLFVYQKKSGESNFCIEKGTIVYIDVYTDRHTDIYKEDGKPLCYNLNNLNSYKEYFIPLAEWREQQIKIVLDD
jgi:hypothetical protein